MSEPESLRIFRFVLQVGDMEEAVAFYVNLLGTSGRRVHPSRHYFDCGPVILALVDVGDDDRTSRPASGCSYFDVHDSKTDHERAAGLGALPSGEGRGRGPRCPLGPDWPRYTPGPFATTRLLGRPGPGIAPANRINFARGQDAIAQIDRPRFRYGVVSDLIRGLVRAPP